MSYSVLLCLSMQRKCLPLTDQVAGAITKTKPDFFITFFTSEVYTSTRSAFCRTSAEGVAWCTFLWWLYWHKQEPLLEPFATSPLISSIHHNSLCGYAVSWIGWKTTRTYSLDNKESLAASCLPWSTESQIYPLLLTSVTAKELLWTLLFYKQFTEFSVKQSLLCSFCIQCPSLA